MTGERRPRSISLEERLHALESVASLLDWPMPRIRDERVCWEFARIIEGLLTNVARGRGALEIAIGEGLESLAVGDRVFDVGGYCNVPDCARERYGLPASTAVKMMRFARELRKRPLLRAAVRAGTVSVSHAEAVLPVAVGDAEQLWVARAATWTVRALDEAVRSGRRPHDADDPGASDCLPCMESADVGSPLRASDSTLGEPLHGDCSHRGDSRLAATAARGTDDDERWTPLFIDVPPGGQAIIDEGTALARKALDRPAAPKWSVLEWVAAEFLSGTDVAEELAAAAGDASPRRDPQGDTTWFDILGESLDEHCAYWAALVQVPNIAAPPVEMALVRDPKLIDKQLQHHVKMLRQWDVLFGHLAFIFKKMRCWEVAGFPSLAHYWVERLGMAARTVEQRIALEEQLHELPALKTAMKEGRISYEKARLIARYADKVTVQALIEQAEGLSCIELRRRFEANEEAQMSARRKFKAVVPWRIACDVEFAFRVLRRWSRAPLSDGECLVALFAHFVAVWKPLLAQRTTLHRRVLERDGYRCQVPGCSRTAAHAHHIIARSAGGKDEIWNLTSLCAAHHLRGIHMGRLKVAGRAPHQLTWTLHGALPDVEGRWSAVSAAA